MKKFFVSLKFLNSKEKQIFYVILFFILIGILLETISIGSLLPLFSVLIDEDFSNKYSIIYNFIMNFSPLKIFGINDNTNITKSNFLIISTVIFFLIFILFKTLFLVFLIWLQQKFTFSIYRKLSNQLFRGYINQPYEYFFYKNSANILKNISIQLSDITVNLFSLMTLITEFLLVMSIILFLFFYNFVVTFIVFGFFGILSISYFLLVKNNLSFHGNIKKIYDEKLIKNINQTFGGFKNLIIQNKLSTMSSLHSQFIDKLVNSSFKLSLYSNVPRFLLEFTAILSISFIIIIVTFQSKSPNEIIVILGLFLAAAYKILPSIVRILVSSGHLQYGFLIIENLYNEINEFRKTNQNKESLTKINFENKISVKNINYNYKNSKELFKNLNLEINKGEMIGIIGESGSGKSTLVDLLIGLIEPKEGSIEVDDIDISKILKNWQKKIGYVPQDVFLFDDTLAKNIALGFNDNEINLQRIKEVIKLSDLDTFTNNLDDSINTFLGERGSRISGGQKQRIGIARALYSEPEILILDESTSALDLNTERKIIETINNLKFKTTIIIISHRDSTLKNCQKIYKLNNKQLHAI